MNRTDAVKIGLLAGILVLQAVSALRLAPEPGGSEVYVTNWPKPLEMPKSAVRQLEPIPVCIATQGPGMGWWNCLGR